MAVSFSFLSDIKHHVYPDLSKLLPLLDFYGILFLLMKNKCLDAKTLSLDKNEQGNISYYLSIPAFDKQLPPSRVLDSSDPFE